MQTWFRRKDINQVTVHEEGRRLVPTLSWPHLIALGIGAIVGTGIYTLIGVGANLAGPAVLLSFLVAGVVCACAALAYAEMATMMPAAGSAYTYSYIVLGESIAWIVGWSLILEYSLVVSAVAVGWSGSVMEFLNGLGIHIPQALAAGPHAGGIVNLPAVLIVFLVAGMLIAGTKESATLNAVLVIVKVLALGVFVAIAMPHFDTGHMQPFMPFGFAKEMGADGVERGVMAAAAIIFFAFYGFDAISTAAEETKNPGRDLSIGIIGSMVGCTLIYIIVALAAVGAMSYTAFAQSPAPLALIMRELGQGTASKIVAGAAVVALPTVLLAFLYGQSRIFFVMSRDGLLPRALSKVSPRTGTPVAITAFTAVLVAALAGVARLDEIAALANAGTLAAFVAVAACLLVLRKREPLRPRVFRTPLAWVVGPVAILGCMYLFWSLPHKTQLWFLVWNAVGLVAYMVWGRRGSLLARGQEA
ncbi:APA family basic amino acid/polyamine antiporter [Lysobacter niastensis]|uniref:APA family basic amino acid/polyamine antiporter n=1 Tax=Lysobacter niastensis TaxID=380629 RepID=A0ABU1WEH1_9GAMM|nr:amino acid permease [Lysobacter niastensis]MDR7135934.1 APA family basic amino acid/polyamine antiporter [Lysobacter niastensis]